MTSIAKKHSQRRKSKVDTVFNRNLFIIRKERHKYLTGYRRNIYFKFFWKRFNSSRLAKVARICAERNDLWKKVK